MCIKILVSLEMLLNAMALMFTGVTGMQSISERVQRCPKNHKGDRILQRSVQSYVSSTGLQDDQCHDITGFGFPKAT